MKWILVFLITTSAWAIDFPLKPDSELSYPHFCTHKDKYFMEVRYEEKVPYCKRAVSRSMRTVVYNRYNIPKNDRIFYTIDHIIPLSLGGSNDISNLWPQHQTINTSLLEGEVYRKVARGEIKIYEAINMVLKVKYRRVK